MANPSRKHRKQQDLFLLLLLPKASRLSRIIAPHKRHREDRHWTDEQISPPWVNISSDRPRRLRYTGIAVTEKQKTFLFFLILLFFLSSLFSFLKTLSAPQSSVRSFGQYFYPPFLDWRICCFRTKPVIREKLILILM